MEDSFWMTPQNVMSNVVPKGLPSSKNGYFAENKYDLLGKITLIL